MAHQYAFAIGFRRKRGDQILDVYFPKIYFNEQQAIVTTLSKQKPDQTFCLTLTQENLTAIEDKLPHVSLFKSLLNQQHSYLTQDIVLFYLHQLDQPVASAEEGYFKLQLLSQRHVKPHGVSLDGIFGKLTNVAWTTIGPILPEDMPEQRLKALASGQELSVSHVDKFPYLVNYHIPSGVRIASGSQVRLGAYLGEGTTVMPAGYINFNAGTLGNAMVEGRISAGVLVGKNTDIGGGASIMGTLSGGNAHVISIGEKCLLGANSGTGISLGFGCTIAAGLYIYAGMKISLYNHQKEPVDITGTRVTEGQNRVKAIDLSGKNHLLFIQDSQTGKVICMTNPKTIDLNQELHQN